MGQLVDGLRVIEEGLQAGDWVVVNGIQRARPGGKVAPERVKMDALTTSAIKAAASRKSTPPPKSKDSKTTSQEKKAEQ